MRTLHHLSECFLEEETPDERVRCVGYITDKVTWDDLVIMEPELLSLERDITTFSKENKRKRSFCANWVWYRSVEEGGMGFRERLFPLVGWEARVVNRILNSQTAWDIAYHHLYNLLPNCRNCQCM
jgi:hypothetical protein